MIVSTIDAALYAAWESGIQVCNAKGYDFTAECMKNARSGNGATKYYYDSSSVATKIKSTVKFQNVFNSCVNMYRIYGTKNFSGSIEFTTSDNADLYYALQKVEYTATITSSTEIKFTFTDYYNFDSIRVGFTIGAFGNDLGFIEQNLNKIDPFYINIVMYKNFTIPTPAPIDITYQTYTNGRWLANVTNLNDYAGIYGQPVQCVYANLSSGSIKYRVHVKGGDWLSWVTNRTDYAGIYGQNIDGLQMYLVDKPNNEVEYRTYVNGQWLPWVIGTSDYAGIYGQNIEGIQAHIIGKA